MNSVFSTVVIEAGLLLHGLLKPDPVSKNFPWIAYLVFRFREVYGHTASQTGAEMQSVTENVLLFSKLVQCQLASHGQGNLLNNYKPQAAKC